MTRKNRNAYVIYLIFFNFLCDNTLLLFSYKSHFLINLIDNIELNTHKSNKLKKFKNITKILF